MVNFNTGEYNCFHYCGRQVWHVPQNSQRKLLASTPYAVWDGSPGVYL